MNNLVFNTTASQLKTSIYAQGEGEELKPLKLNATDDLSVAVANAVTISNAVLTVDGTVTVSAITDPVTIANTLLTVGGSVTVSAITDPVTIANTLLTVGGSVAVSAITDPVTIANTLLTVGGSVEVSAITDPVTIANTLLTVGGSVAVSAITDPVTIANTLLTVGGTVTIGGYTVVTDTVSNEEVTGDEVIFPNKDISTFKQASIILYNGDADTPITLSLQISPTTADGDYIDSGDPIVIPANGNYYISGINYAHYARLQCAMGTETAILNAYFIGQA